MKSSSPLKLWTAVAERSDDTAFERTTRAGIRDARRACQSGGALRFPPQSKGDARQKLLFNS
jgi:hypothetical protein